MVRIIRIAATAGIIFLFSVITANAQTYSHVLSTPPQFDLSVLKCHDLLDASLTNRGYAVMLYWGYEAGKAGKTNFVTATIRSQTQKLTDYCASNPQMLVFDAIKHIRSK